MALGKRGRSGSVVSLSEEFTVLRGANAVVEFTGGVPNDTLYAPKTGNAPGQGAIKPASWGADNLQPSRILQLVHSNHLKPRLLETERNLLLGSRIGVFTRRVEKNPITGKSAYVLDPVLRPEIEDWMEMVDLDATYRSLSYNFAYSHNFFCDISLEGSKKIVRFDSLDFCFTRAEQMKQGRVQNYYYHPDWKNYKPAEVTVIPAFDKLKLGQQGRFVYHGRDHVPGQVYYDCPAWWGTEQWTLVSNLIPLFHKAGLKNGYNIKYHIRIPRSYFSQFGDPAAQRKAERELMDQMNEMLSGVENADKAFISRFDTVNGKAEGWEIIPIENKMSDDAYSKVNDQANIAHTSGHGIDPSLAGIDTGGKLGGSGSEKRISYQLHLAMHATTPRSILLEPLNKVVRRLMGWEDVVFGFEDVELTTLDKNPTGQQGVVNSAIG